MIGLARQQPGSKKLLTMPSCSCSRAGIPALRVPEPSRRRIAGGERWIAAAGAFAAILVVVGLAVLPGRLFAPDGNEAVDPEDQRLPSSNVAWYRSDLGGHQSRGRITRSLCVVLPQGVRTRLSTSSAVHGERNRLRQPPTSTPPNLAISTPSRRSDGHRGHDPVPRNHQSLEPESYRGRTLGCRCGRGRSTGRSSWR